MTDLTKTTLKQLKKGEYFKRKADARKVYTKDTYCRETKKYDCVDCDDAWGAGLQLKGTTTVFTGFNY